MVYFVGTIYFNERREIQAYQDYIQMVKPIVERYHGRYIVRSDIQDALRICPQAT